MKKKIRIPTRPYAGVDASQRLKERKEKFIESGLESFGTVGYARSTITGICRHAGLTERYFYESFQGKEDLLSAVYQRLISEIENNTVAIMKRKDLSPPEMAIESLKTFYIYFYDDPRRARVQLFEVLGVSPAIDMAYQSAMRVLAKWIALIIEAVFPDVNAKKLKDSIIPTGTAGAMIEIANQWALDGFKKPVDDIVAEAMEAFQFLGAYLNDREKRQR